MKAIEQYEIFRQIHELLRKEQKRGAFELDKEKLAQVNKLFKKVGINGFKQIAFIATEQHGVQAFADGTLLNFFLAYVKDQLEGKLVKVALKKL